MTVEDTTDWEGIVCTVVICKGRELAAELLLLVVKIFKSPMYPIADPNSFSSQ
jgi:hypothetical protein